MRQALKEIFYILKGISKIKITFLTFCIGLTAIFEIIGVAFVVPFITIVSKPELLTSSRFLQKIMVMFNLQQPLDLVCLIGGAFFALIVAGNLFSAFTAWYSTRFGYIEGYKICTNLLKKYMLMPYPFFFNRNSKELTKILLFDVDRVVVGIVVTSIQIITKLLIVISIGIFLALADPMIALLSTLVLGGAYVIAYKIIKRALSQAGKKSAIANANQYKAIGEAIEGVKEIKVLGKEDIFVNHFAQSALMFAKAEAINAVSPYVTRYILEIIAFGGMMLMVLFLFNQKGNLVDMLPLLSLYVFASYRLLPAMQQIFSGISIARHYRTCLELVYAELTMAGSKENLQEVPLAFNHQFELKNVSYQYPQAKYQALTDINLTIPLNATVGIVGHTGSGKSTLIDILLGLLVPTDGQLLVDELEINENNIRSWQRKIGYVPQKIFLIDESIEKNIAFGIPENEIEMAKVHNAAKLANIHDFIINELPAGYQTSVGENGIRLSGGQKQRLGIARALYHDPSLLIFDEATSALDGMTEKVIMEAIAKLSHRKTIVMIAHRLNTVKECDLIYVLNKGDIVGRGSFDDLLKDNPLFQNLAKASTADF